MSYMKRTTFTISLSPEVFSRLTSSAWRLDVSRGAVVRMALQVWFGRHDPKDSNPQGSWTGLRMNLMATPETNPKIEDLLKTQISIPPDTGKRRKKNRLDIPPAATGEVSKS